MHALRCLEVLGSDKVEVGDMMKLLGFRVVGLDGPRRSLHLQGSGSSRARLKKWGSPSISVSESPDSFSLFYITITTALAREKTLRKLMIALGTGDVVMVGRGVGRK